MICTLHPAVEPPLSMLLSMYHPMQSEQVDGMMGINQAPTSFISQVGRASACMCAAGEHA